MKFKFCGELDAPDWLLKEISVIAKISSIRVRLIVAQVVAHLLGGSIEYEKVEKFVQDAKLSTSDIRALLAALQFIISNAAKYDVDDTVLGNELAQLGMPKEHCDALCKPYKDNKEKLRAKFSELVLTLPRLESVDWRLDYILSSSYVTDVNQSAVQLNFHVSTPKGPETPHFFDVSEEKFKILLGELRTARLLMATTE